MSDRLTVSATFSILMMAAYVLYGVGGERMSADMPSPATIARASEPGLLINPGRLFSLVR